MCDAARGHGDLNTLLGDGYPRPPRTPPPVHPTPLPCRSPAQTPTSCTHWPCWTSARAPWYCPRRWCPITDTIPFSCWCAREFDQETSCAIGLQGGGCYCSDGVLFLCRDDSHHRCLRTANPARSCRLQDMYMNSVGLFGSITVGAGPFKVRSTHYSTWGCKIG